VRISEKLVPTSDSVIGPTAAIRIDAPIAVAVAASRSSARIRK
jgi:hypothetical protein